MFDVEKLNLLSLFIEPRLLWGLFAFLALLSLATSILLWWHKMKTHKTKTVTNLEIVYGFLWLIAVIGLLILLQSYGHSL